MCCKYSPWITNMTVSLLTLVKFTTKPLVTVTLALFHLAVLLVMTQLRSVLFAVGSNKEDKTSIVIVIADSDFVISLANLIRPICCCINQQSWDKYAMIAVCITTTLCLSKYGPFAVALTKEDKASTVIVTTSDSFVIGFANENTTRPYLLYQQTKSR
jgi:hypothetical protein